MALEKEQSVNDSYFQKESNSSMLYSTYARCKTNVFRIKHLMQDKFFRRTRLGPRINNLIKTIEEMMGKEDFDQAELKMFSQELRNVTNEPQYPNIPLRLRNKVTELLTFLEFSPPSQFTIQVPSDEHLLAMNGMIAGMDEDQHLRLKHIKDVIVQETNDINTVVHTDPSKMERHWQLLFQAIGEGNLELALQCFMNIPQTDLILKTMLSVHPADYLKEIISYSVAAAKHHRVVNQTPDIVYTSRTFEILVCDLATTLQCTTPVCVSFGLPTHHASASRAAGFCFLNKTAMLIKGVQDTPPQPVHALIIGTDVNRDDGLAKILWDHPTPYPICHVDIYDSRVYPNQNKQWINQEFGSQGTTLSSLTTHWQNDTYHYFALDLAQHTRVKGTIHPALSFAIGTMKQQLSQAKTDGYKIMLVLPTGWDSHADETAPCGRLLDQEHELSLRTAYKHRFTNQDLRYFYEEFFTLYQQYSDIVTCVYWGLEGGYEPTMYVEQLKNFLSQLQLKLLPPTHDQSSSARPASK